MLELITKDFITIITSLLPGFLASWVFYGLSSHPKPANFEKIIQALIFTFLIQVSMPVLKTLLLLIGDCFALIAWSPIVENLASTVLAIFLGLLLAYITNNDILYSKLRKWGFTSKTSHPSEWFYVFTEKVTFVILNLKDGRRLYGWPKEWPIESGKGQFYIMLPSWIDDEGNTIDVHELDGILINANDVRWVEFLSDNKDQIHE